MMGKGALSSSSHPDSIHSTERCGERHPENLWTASTGTVQVPVPRIFFLSQICITPFRARYRYRPKPKVPGEYRDLQANYLENGSVIRLLMSLS